MSELLDKTILITGVAGFIGRYVARHFHQAGWSVVGVDNSPPENAPLANMTLYHQMRLPDAQLGDLLQSLQPQVLIHCAGRAAVGLSVTDPGADFYGNTVATFEVLNALRLHAPTCRFIFLSSAAVYGNPIALPITETQPLAPVSPYGFHKLQSEQLCVEYAQIYGLPTASVRIFSAYGPGLRRQVIWDICQKVMSQGSLKLQGTGQESRDFIHALDIAQALAIVASQAPMVGEAYNLSTGQEMSIAMIASLVLSALEVDLEPEFDGVVPPGSPLNWRADISKLKSLGFEPTITFERGVKTFANWCRAELLGV
jgi:UDP-glucose 4-epimerase